MISKIEELLKVDKYDGSKDWREGDLVARVNWLLSMYDSLREENELLLDRFSRPNKETNLEGWVKRKVTVNSKTMGGEFCFEGTRVTLKRVASYAKSGETYSTIFAEFPFLSTEDVRNSVVFLNQRG